MMGATVKPTSNNMVLIASSVHNWNDLRIYHKEALTICRLANTKLMGVANGFEPEQIESLEVMLLPAAVKGGSLDRILTRLGRQIHISRELLHNNYRVFHFHDPELIIVAWLAKLRGCKVIYDMHEDAMHMLKGRDWLPGFAAAFLGRMMRCLEWGSGLIFDELILAEKSYAKHAKGKKKSLVLNYPLPIQSKDPSKRLPDESLKLVYVGSLTHARGIGDLIDAVVELAGGEIPVQLFLFGDCCEATLREKIDRAEEYGVQYQGWIPVLELIDEMSNYHVGVSPLHDLPNYRYSLPTKILDYFSFGLPVVSSRLPAIVAEIGESSAIATYLAGDIKGLKNAILSFIDEDKRQGAVLEARNIGAAYSWVSQAKVLEEIYGRCLA